MVLKQTGPGLQLEHREPRECLVAGQRAAPARFPHPGSMPTPPLGDSLLSLGSGPVGRLALTSCHRASWDQTGLSNRL